jgi:hypothetical protein
MSSGRFALRITDRAERLALPTRFFNSLRKSATQNQAGSFVKNSPGEKERNAYSPNKNWVALLDRIVILFRVVQILLLT